MSILTKLLDPNEREVKRHHAVAEAINALEPELKALDDAGLRARSDALREQAREDHDLDELLIEAFALCREAGRRSIGLRHFDVQLVGGIVLHQGKIAEMKTGEGKTLVASLALYLNALAGKGVHLVTVNDYLARRDAGWMAPIYHLLGMSVGVNVGTAGTFVYDPEYLDETHPDSRLQHLRPASKKEAYDADITYATNSELAFDYLRDNMARDLSQCSQRGLNYAIVDEVDSILIDEARTPHIISGQSDESTDKYYQYARWAARLAEGEDFEVDLKHKSASLTEIGIAKMERWTGIKNIYDLENVIEAHQINQAESQGALPPRPRLPRQGRRDRDRGRVHRPHHARPALVRRPASGDRGEGRGQSPARAEDDRDDHRAELLPAVRKAGGHDRHGGDRGRGVSQDLRS